MNVVESEDARRDVLETYHYIALDSVIAAERWLDSIMKCSPITR